MSANQTAWECIVVSASGGSSGIKGGAGATVGSEKGGDKSEDELELLKEEMEKLDGSPHAHPLPCCRGHWHAL